MVRSAVLKPTSTSPLVSDPTTRINTETMNASVVERAMPIRASWIFLPLAMVPPRNTLKPRHVVPTRLGMRVGGEGGDGGGNGGDGGGNVVMVVVMVVMVVVMVVMMVVMMVMIGEAWWVTVVVSQ